MNENLGVKNEYEIMNYLNYRKVKELNLRWRRIIKKMFNGLRRNDLLEVMHYPDKYAKPDLIIKINNRIRLLSIKTGKNTSVHNESIESFFNFLQKINISNRTLKIIRFYHYGYSPNFSNGGVPFTRLEILEKFGKYIKQANEELNKDYIIREVVHRCVLKGTELRKDEINYLYYGTLNKGFLLSKEQVYDLILKDKSDENRGIHFGGLIYQPDARSIRSERINNVKIKWPILCVRYYKIK